MSKSVDKATLINSLTRRYEHVPGGRRAIIIRDVVLLYEETKHLLADPSFNEELLKGDAGKFHQRCWEMILGRHLIKMGADIIRKRSGPDFGFGLKGRTIWIEAVAPNRTDAINDYYRAEALNRGGWFSADIFHLRWTQVLDGKITTYATYLEKGWVGPNDICIVAVNSGLLGSLGMMGKSSFPAPIDVLFGVGAEYAVINPDLMTIVDQGHRLEPSILNKNGSPVPKRFFLESGATHISAVLATGITPESWAPLVAVHNPTARNPLPLGNIGAEWEYYLENCGAHFELRVEQSKLGPVSVGERTAATLAPHDN